MKITKNNRNEWLFWPETKEEKEMTMQLTSELLHHHNQNLTISHAYLPVEPMTSEVCYGIWLKKE